MTTLKTLAAAGMLCSTLALLPVGAQAQSPSQAQPARSGFDAYRAVAITTGVVVGTAVAIVVTDGLIIPVYAWATGGSMTSGLTAAGLASEGVAVTAGSAEAAAGGMGLFRGTMRLLGAIGGGPYADSLYSGR